MRQIYYKSLKNNTFKKIDSLRKGAWLHIDNASLPDLEEVCNELDIDLEDVRDALDPYEVPRLEKHPKYTLIFARVPIERGEDLHTQTLTIILCKEIIVTVCPKASSIISQLLAKNPKLHTTQKTKFVLYVLPKITEAFHAKIRSVQNNVLKTKGQVEHADSKHILSLTKNEETLNQYQSALVPLGNALEQLAKGKIFPLHEEDEELLEDLLIALKQSLESSRVHLKSIVSLRSCYQMIFTNTLNKTTKILTSLAVIFMIPTLLASLYGMNVALPFASSPIAFLGILGFSLILSIGALIVFYWRKWL